MQLVQQLGVQRRVVDRILHGGVVGYGEGDLRGRRKGRRNERGGNQQRTRGLTCLNGVGRGFIYTQPPPSYYWACSGAL